MSGTKRIIDFPTGTAFDGYLLHDKAGGITTKIALGSVAAALVDWGMSTLALGETVSTAYRGDRGKTAYDHSQVSGSNPHGTSYAQLASIPAALDALDGLTPAADRVPYFTGANTAALATLTAFARTLLDDADAPTALGTLGAVGGRGNGAANRVGLWSDANTMTSGAGLTYSTGNGLDVATGPLRVGGTQRISSTGRFDATSIYNTGLTAGRVVHVTTGGQLVDDAGLTTTQSGSVTNGVSIGEQATSGTALLNLVSSGGNARLQHFKGTYRIYEQGYFSVDNTVRHAVYDDVGVWIDDVVSYSRAAGGPIILGGYSATRRSIRSTKCAATGAGHVVADSNGDFNTQAQSYASLYASTAAAAQSIPTGTTYTKVTPFDSTGPALNSSASAVNDNITIGRAGTYEITFSRSFQVGTANIGWHVAILKNGSVVPGGVVIRKTLTNNETQSGSHSVHVTCAANDLITVGVYHDNAGSVNLTYDTATLTVANID